MFSIVNARFFLIFTLLFTIASQSFGQDNFKNKVIQKTQQQLNKKLEILLFRSSPNIKELQLAQISELIDNKKFSFKLYHSGGSVLSTTSLTLFTFTLINGQIKRGIVWGLPTIAGLYSSFHFDDDQAYQDLSKDLNFDKEISDLVDHMISLFKDEKTDISPIEFQGYKEDLKSEIFIQYRNKNEFSQSDILNHFSKRFDLRNQVSSYLAFINDAKKLVVKSKVAITQNQQTRFVFLFLTLLKEKVKSNSDFTESEKQYLQSLIFEAQSLNKALEKLYQN